MDVAQKYEWKRATPAIAVASIITLGIGLSLKKPMVVKVFVALLGLPIGYYIAKADRKVQAA